MHIKKDSEVTPWLETLGDNAIKDIVELSHSTLDK
jgi:hypothetical protein